VTCRFYIKRVIKSNSIICIVTFSLVLINLLASLAVYSLWDDETMVSLVAKGVVKTGDTIASVGQNIVAYREGIALVDLKDRFSPPLATYLVAFTFLLFGVTTFAARIPFALSGMFTFLLGWYWLYRARVDWLFRSIIIICLLGNVSLFLYFRQARYYGLVLFFTLLIGYLYLHPRKTKAWAAMLSLSFVGLFVSHPLACAALGIAIFFDVLCYQRDWLKRTWAQWFWLSFPTLLLIGLSLLVWNPYMTKTAEYQSHISLADRFTIFFWTWRDILTAEFIAPVPIGIALIVGAFKKDFLPVRCFQAIVIVIAVVSSTTHQMVSVTSVADIRYVISIIPIGIFLGSWGIYVVFKKKPWLALICSVIFFWTNLFNSALFRGQGIQSTMALFWHELLSPNPEPYAPACEWIRKHVPPNSSIWVLPDYMTYPLMFHAPDPIYAWQLRPEQKQEEQFKNLPDIHFKGLVPPDFIVVFGPSVEQIRQLMTQWSLQGLRYQEVTRLMTFWKDLYRPELFWRTFKPIENFDPNTEAIYIFQRQS